jgi:glycosyltransferase involved in cell wall biosynthesis
MGELLYITLSSARTVKNSIHQDIINELKEKFENISIFCLGKRYKEENENTTIYQGNFLDWFKVIKKKKNINKIYANDYFLGGLLATVVKNKTKAPLFIRIGSPWIYQLNSISAIIKTIILKILRPYVLNKCDFVVYNSKSIVYKGMTHKHAVIYNGVDLKKFKPMKVERKTKKKLNIIFIGNLNKEKGVEFLLKALNTKRLKANVHLTIVGDGPLLQKFKKEYPFAQYCGRLEKNVLPKAINAHDALVLPTFVESFPNVLLEAMACGKPVISTKVFGIPEMITNGIEGILIQSKNVKSLRKAIITLINFPELGKRMGKEGRKSVKKKFHKAIQIKKTSHNLINLTS